MRIPKATITRLQKKFNVMISAFEYHSGSYKASMLVTYWNNEVDRNVTARVMVLESQTYDNAISEEINIVVKLSRSAIADLVFEELEGAGIQINQYGFDDICEELEHHQNEGVSPKYQLDYIINQAIPDGLRENYFEF